MEPAAIERGIKIVGIILAMFVLELFVIIGIFLFIAGALTDQPIGSIAAFIIAAGSGYLIRCLIDPLMDVIDEQ